MTPTSNAAATQTDWHDWLRRWDRQQQLHIPDREERFAVVVAALQAFTGEAPRVLDLGCGPGSLSARVRERLPDAEILAIDTDPVLLTIARGAFADTANVQFVDADLRGAWIDALPSSPPFDAAVSTTALHWLSLSELCNLYAALASVLRPGGVVLNGDRIDFDSDQTAIADGARRMAPDWVPATDGAEDYDTWWAAANDEPALAAATRERRTRAHEHPHHEEPQTFEFHRAALLASGFSEVGTLWQRLSNRVLVAVR